MDGQDVPNAVRTQCVPERAFPNARFPNARFPNKQTHPNARSDPTKQGMQLVCNRVRTC